MNKLKQCQFDSKLFYCPLVLKRRSISVDFFYKKNIKVFKIHLDVISFVDFFYIQLWVFFSINIFDMFYLFYWARQVRDYVLLKKKEEKKGKKNVLL